jgi:CDP-diacylglycerol--glycerol-3-phosphate 3-phosphatidyltransferase
MNLPNQITVGRLLLAVIFLILMGRFDFSMREQQLGMLDVAFWIFVVAAVSDILDGYLARKQNQVTSFGRILDPFVDKILVCGGFILLLGDGFRNPAGESVTGLAAWMVVVIVARELLVSGLRGFSEASGTPFAANYWGKAKMLIQCITVPLIVKTVGNWRDIRWVMTWREIMIWLTIIITALSVFAYLAAARKYLAERARE